MPVPRPVTDKASSISVVAESSIENACTLANGSSSECIGACSAGKLVPLGKFSNKNRL
jgi:hypothetical protein